jgi:hypothetical protein
VDDVDPTTPESNQKPSGKDAEADARSESLSKAMKDPSTSDDLDHAQNLKEDLKQNMEEHTNSANADPPLLPLSPSPAAAREPACFAIHTKSRFEEEEGSTGLKVHTKSRSQEEEPRQDAFHTKSKFNQERTTGHWCAGVVHSFNYKL